MIYRPRGWKAHAEDALSAGIILDTGLKPSFQDLDHDQKRGSVTPAKAQE